MISSSGMLFVYLAGKIVGNAEINVQQVNTYEYLLDFYEQVRELQGKVSEDADVEFFCVLGISEKVEKVASAIENQIKENFDIFEQENNIEIDNDDLDFLEQSFNRLIQEQIFQTDSVRFPRKYQIDGGAWKMYCFWAGEDYNDEGYLLIDDVAEAWMEYEKPLIFGKQMMIQSYLLKDLNSRKIIGLLPDRNNGEWKLLLEGGLKLCLNTDIPYTRERVGVRDIELFTMSGVDAIINNPVYAYGIYYEPQEVCEEWHKVFLYAAALRYCEWDREKLVRVYEKFLDFLEENVCHTIPVQPMIDKDLYWNVFMKTIMSVRNFLKGEEEPVISKDMLLLLNSRYIYLPYIYDLMDEFGPETQAPGENLLFEKDKLEKIVRLSERGDTYQKGDSWERAAEYFIGQIKGLKISGRRVQTAAQEIDLSAVNVSMDSKLWEMGAYILIECKNWSEKVDVQVIRGLSHISTLKGNKTTILFAANGVTRNAEAEILRAAVNRNFILCFTKEELLKLESNKGCYELLVSKWEGLKRKAEEEMIL